jgi:hypothetical protein
MNIQVAFVVCIQQIRENGTETELLQKTQEKN